MREEEMDVCVEEALASLGCTTKEQHPLRKGGSQTLLPPSSWTSSHSAKETRGEAKVLQIFRIERLSLIP